MHVQTLKAPTYQAKVRPQPAGAAATYLHRRLLLRRADAAWPPPAHPARRPVATSSLVQIADAEGNMASHPVTVDEVHVLKKGQYGVMLGVKGGYFFAARHDTKLNEQQGPAAAAAMAIGFYWAVGACPGGGLGGGGRHVQFVSLRASLVLARVFNAYPALTSSPCPPSTRRPRRVIRRAQQRPACAAHGGGASSASGGSLPVRRAALRGPPAPRARDRLRRAP